MKQPIFPKVIMFNSTDGFVEGYKVPIKPSDYSRSGIEKAIAEGKPAFYFGFYLEWEDDKKERVLLHMPKEWYDSNKRYLSKDYSLTSLLCDSTGIDGTFYCREGVIEHGLTQVYNDQFICL